MKSISLKQQTKKKFFRGTRDTDYAEKKNTKILDEESPRNNIDHV